jgi:hypothetical protein
VLATLKPGADLAVGILPAEKDNPPRSGIPRHEFLNIYFLSVNGALAFSVEGYNRCAEHNEKVGHIVDPIMLSISVLLLFYAVRAVRG